MPDSFSNKDSDMKERREHRPRRRSGSRRGAAAIEAAIIMPLLILFTLGGIDLAQYINLSQVVTNSSREAARISSRYSTKSVDEVRDAVEDYVRDWYPHIDDDEMEDIVFVSVRMKDGSAIPEQNLGAVESGEALRIDVAFNFGAIRWLPGLEYCHNDVKLTTSYSRRE